MDVAEIDDEMVRPNAAKIAVEPVRASDIEIEPQRPEIGPERIETRPTILVYTRALLGQTALSILADMTEQQVCTIVVHAITDRRPTVDTDSGSNALQDAGQIPLKNACVGAEPSPITHLQAEDFVVEDTVTEATENAVEIVWARDKPNPNCTAHAHARLEQTESTTAVK